jgi:GntR family transcriptional regulator, transcriptional repressor for pyruvate dehydrogenase complex
MKDKVPFHGKSVGSKIRPIQKVSIAEEIAKQIMELISSGSLRPGQRLPSERELVEHFRASRPSVREALRGLSIVGVLNARVGDGTSVAVNPGMFMRKVMELGMVTEKPDIDNLLEVRIALEVMSAARAARNATEADLHELRGLVAKMKACGTNETQFARLDAEFHVVIAKASGNSLILEFVSMIRSQLIRALTKALRSPNAILHSNKEHAILLDAIESHDADASRAAMLAHLEGFQRHSMDTESRLDSKADPKPLPPGKRPRTRKA